MVGNNLNDLQLQQLVDRTIIKADLDYDGKISYEQLRMLNPNRKFNLILVDHNLGDVQQIQKELVNTIYPKTTHMDFNIAAALHLASAGTKAKIVLTGLGAD